MTLSSLKRLTSCPHAHFRIALTVLLSITSVVAPVKAQEQPSRSTTQVPTTTELADACIQNRAETLPVPFTDVSPEHWAFKAVMTMHYCGAFRGAAPRDLFGQVKPTQSQQRSPVEN